MRILHVSPLAYGVDGVWGGGERFALELARAQACHHDVTLLVFGPRAAVRQEGSLRIVTLRRRGVWGNLMNPLSEKLPGYLRRCDIVHLHQWKTLLSAASAFWAAGVGRRVFATDHGGDGPNPLERLRPSRVVNAHLAVSRFSASLLPEFVEHHVIGAGVDVERYTPGPGASRADEIVFVGRLRAHKGIDTLIRALEPGWRLHVLGRSVDERYLSDLRRLAKGRDVHFHLSASDEQIIDSLRRARVAALPSLERTVYGETVKKSELFGMALAEAMACGTPAVCTRVGGMPEVVEDGRSGFIVPPGDPDALRAALSRVLTAPEDAWRSWSAAAVQRIRETFTWNHVAERCFAAYSAARERNGALPGFP